MDQGLSWFILILSKGKMIGCGVSFEWERVTDTTFGSGGHTTPESGGRTTPFYPKSEIETTLISRS